MVMLLFAVLFVGTWRGFVGFVARAGSGALPRGVVLACGGVVSGAFVPWCYGRCGGVRFVWVCMVWLSYNWVFVALVVACYISPLVFSYSVCVLSW